MHAVTVELAVGRGAQMVFHVARALHLVGRGGAALELVENCAMRLTHHLRQNVEPAAVRHADDNLFDAERPATLDDLFERRNHRLCTVETETLGACEFQIAEFLETFSLNQLVEDRAFAFARERNLLIRPFDPRLNPTFLRRIGDVHELDSERLAVRAAKDRENFAQRAEFQA